MNFLSDWEFSRGARAEGVELDTEAVYAVENSILFILIFNFLKKVFSMAKPLVVSVDGTEACRGLDSPYFFSQAYKLWVVVPSGRPHLLLNSLGQSPV